MASRTTPATEPRIARATITTNATTPTASNPATRPSGEEAARDRVWDSVADAQMIGRYGSTFAKLHEISKPTVAAVQGWCIAGGTDMVLNADIIVAGEGARFGYPPARVWGVPEAPWVWVARLGLERAKRYLFTGDELTAREAAVARHTQEGLDFVARAQEIGWREAVRERDRPFGDYGERTR